MKTSAFYNIAKDYAETAKKDLPAYVPDDAKFCIIQTDSSEIFTGFTGVRIVNDAAVLVPAEENTIIKMMAVKKTHASQMMVIGMDGSVVQPSEEMLELLIDANPANRQCAVAVSSEEDKFASDLLPSKGVSDIGAPAEFVSGFEFDESNPFYEPETAAEEAPVATTAHPNTADPKFLYNQPGQQPGQPYQQQGFPGQQMGYPGQQGYPQQQMGYPGQQGYPQQQGYPGQGMGGYPQQGMGGYPQQGMGGYPQQGMGGYPQQGMGGYPQQGMGGYPQQGGFRQGMPAQGINPGMPAQGAARSVYAGQPIQPAAASQHLSAAQSAMVSQFLGGGGGSFKKRLANFIDEEDDAEMDAILNDIENDGGDDEDDGSNNATMSKADMKKLAEQQKKLAKQNQKRNG